MKKLLFIMPDLGGGGAEKVLIDIINYLDKSKFDITIFLIKKEGVYLEKVPEHINVIYGSSSINNKVLNYLYFRFIKYFPSIYRKIKIKQKYDVEIGFIEGLSTKLVSYSNNEKSRKIAWVHTDLESNNWSKKLFRRNEENLCYKRMEKVVFVSQDAKEKFNNIMDIDKTKLKVIYNPLDEQKIIRLSNEKLIDKKNNNYISIISVGRLVEAKGFERLINIHKKIIDEGIKHNLTILGSGVLKKTLENLICNLKVSDTCRIIEYTDNPYVYIKSSDIVVVGSIYEGFSLVTAESMILNKPIVATAVAGPNELLYDQNLGMITENNENDLYIGIKKVLLDKNIRDNYTNKLSKIDKFPFSKNIVMDSIENLIEN